MKNALCCFLLLVLVFGACFHLPFVAFCCSSLLFLVFEIESILSQKPKQANAFYCSLWLFVARFGFLWMFPFEHRIARCGFLLVRKTKTSNERQKMSKWKPGFKCKVVPPRKLYHPVLPQRIKVDSYEKLVFTLCKTCAETRNQNVCKHTDNQRSFIGTWTTDEVSKALEKGYKILRIYEVWHFAKSTDALH